MELDLTNKREQLDSVDHEILNLLARRMEIVRTIGMLKKATNETPLQPARWQAVIEDRTNRGESVGLSSTLVVTIWNAIHTEALRIEEAV